MATIEYSSNKWFQTGKAKYRQFFLDGSSIDVIEVHNNVTKSNWLAYHRFFTGMFTHFDDY